MSESPPVLLERKGFIVLSLTLFVVAYNISVIQPVMPEVVRTLGSNIGYIQGALILFSLVNASFAPTVENLCQFYGRTRIFRLGLALYGFGVLLTALSPHIGFFVVSFSLVTGLAATPLVSTPWALMDTAYEGQQEQQATLMMILASMMGGISGVMLGGLIAAQVGWRWAFLPSVLVWIVIFAMVRFLPKAPVMRNEPIDWVGGLLSFVGFGSILLGISLAGVYGWWEPKERFSIAGMVIPPFAISIVPTLISVGVICLSFFIYWQRQQRDRSGASLLRVGLLRKRVFVIGTLTAMLHTLISSGVQFNLYQFVPAVLELNPFQTALAVLPYTVTLVLVLVTLLRFLALGDRIAPKYVVYVGITLLAVGLGVLYQSVHLSMTALEMIPGLILMGAGSGIFLSYIGALTYSVATSTEKPEGSGIYNPIQNLGNSLGRGILGTTLIFFASQGIVDGVLNTLGQTLEPAQRKAAISKLQTMVQTFSKDEVQAEFAKLPDAVKPYLNDIIDTAAINGMRAALLIAFVLSLLCLILATALPKYPKRRLV